VLYLSFLFFFEDDRKTYLFYTIFAQNVHQPSFILKYKEWPFEHLFIALSQDAYLSAFIQSIYMQTKVILLKENN